ncbi:exported hypothetical protein [Paraburkholderia ribeironis]|uniref:Uncharacterized protein n=1 Tax=Paraburkholderia ribeironis TaxID=1247936 RepID=A0A1N7SGM1_9BURK|nr:exported hypothetical protein [Paraburkholderia ribeironis]
MDFRRWPLLGCGKSGCASLSSSSYSPPSNSATHILPVCLLARKIKKYFLFHKIPAYSECFRFSRLSVGRGIDEPIPDSHYGSESDVWE